MYTRVNELLGWLDSLNWVALTGLALAAILLLLGGSSVYEQVAFLRGSERTDGVIESVSQETEWVRKGSNGGKKQSAYWVIHARFQLPSGELVRFRFEARGWAGVSEGEHVKVGYLADSPADSARVLGWSYSLGPGLVACAIGLLLLVFALRMLLF